MRRTGKFTLPASDLNDEQLREVFNYLSCIPLEVRYMPWINTIEYTVESDRFEITECGMLPNEYEITIEYNEFDDGFDVKVKNKLANNKE